MRQRLQLSKLDVHRDCLRVLAIFFSVSAGLFWLFLGIIGDMMAPKSPWTTYLFLAPCAVAFGCVVWLAGWKRPFLIGLALGSILAIPWIPYHPWKALLARSHSIKRGMGVDEVTRLLNGFHQEWRSFDGIPVLVAQWDPRGGASGDQVVVRFRDGKVVEVELMRD